MFCKQCGKPIDDGAVFCQHCGANQQTTATQPNDIRHLPQQEPNNQPPKKSNALAIIRWALSIGFIIDGLGLTLTKHILFIFMIAFGLLINPKFNDLYTKVTKKEPLKKGVHIAVSVCCFLMIYVAMGVASIGSDDTIQTADSGKEVFTTIETKVTEPAVVTAEETTVTTTEETTITTTEETTVATTEETTVTTEETTEVTTTEAGSNEFSLTAGKLLSVVTNDDIMVVKVKISGSYSNDATVKQNYHNVEDIIKQGGYKYNEIQYWAVADMNDGSESKVVSFTVNKYVIDNVKEGHLAAIQLGDYVDDLWIHPSLR